MPKTGRLKIVPGKHTFFYRRKKVTGIFVFIILDYFSGAINFIRNSSFFLLNDK